MSVMEDYREQQIEMLKATIHEHVATIAALRTELSMALDRAELAEDRVRLLREEIRSARETPFGEPRE